MIAFFNGQFLPKDEVWISPDDRGFLFSDGAYEVIRAYTGQPFLMAEHLRRLRYSLGALRIALPEVEALQGVVEELIRRNDLTRDEATIYIQVTRGVAPRRHAFPPEATPPTRYVTATPFLPRRKKWEDGVAVITVPDIRWGRCDIKSLSLLPSVLASQEAEERGAEEAIFVHEGVITEGAHTNVCAVIDGQLVTHPATHRILAGITRGLVLGLCSQLGIPWREDPIPITGLKAARELMILGTTTEIMPVVQVDGEQVGDGRPGPMTRKLQRAFRATVEAVATNLWGDG
jgi:D-alanine transaminase